MKMDLKIFKNILQLFIIFSLTFLVQAPYAIYTKSIKCFNLDKTLVTVNRCEVKAVRGKKGVIYGTCSFSRPITKEMELWVT